VATEVRTGGRTRGNRGYEAVDERVDYLRISAPNVEHMRSRSACESSLAAGRRIRQAKDGRCPSAADKPKSHHLMRPIESAGAAVPHLGRGKVSRRPIGHGRPSNSTTRPRVPSARKQNCPRLAYMSPVVSDEAMGRLVSLVDRHRRLTTVSRSSGRLRISPGAARSWRAFSISRSALIRSSR